LSKKSAKVLLVPPNADLDALSSIYGISLLEKDAKLFYTSFSPKAKNSKKYAKITRILGVSNLILSLGIVFLASALRYNV